MNIIKEIHRDLAGEIAAMNKLTARRLTSKEELVNIIGQYLIESGGKRIRPLLTIITSKMFGYSGEGHIKLAAAVEFIHTATILHDDVVDGSKMRRFRPTANIVWGNQASILVGDYLFSQSFKLMLETNSVEALESLARAAAIISEGEVSQLVQLTNRNFINETEYEQIITAKTAELFSTACEVGGIIAGQPLENNLILKDFGLILGKIFQIIDDTLDYFGDTEQIGKNIGDDFLEGKVTLPLILLYEQLSPIDKTKLQELIKARKRNGKDLSRVVSLLVSFNINMQIKNKLLQLKSAAQRLINQINIQNEYKNYLIALIDFAIDRSY